MVNNLMAYLLGQNNPIYHNLPQTKVKENRRIQRVKVIFLK